MKPLSLKRFPPFQKTARKKAELYQFITDEFFGIYSRRKHSGQQTNLRLEPEYRTTTVSLSQNIELLLYL